MTGRGNYSLTVTMASNSKKIGKYKQGYRLTYSFHLNDYNRNVVKIFEADYPNEYMIKCSQIPNANTLHSGFAIT